MAQRGRPIVRVTVSPSERTTLEQWARRRTTAQGLAQRAQIVLACAAGQSNSDVAAAMRITRQTVGRWRQRFVAKRLDGLLDEPRPGAPRRITDAQVERVIIDTLEKLPADATHWSTRRLAKELALSHATVGRIWRAFGLQPHRSETFKLSRDPLFIDKVRDIVGLYLALATPADIATKVPAAMGEANTLRVVFFILTFFSIGVLSNFKKLWQEGIGKLAAVYVLSLFGFVIWVGLLISWLFFAGVKPPLAS